MVHGETFNWSAFHQQAITREYQFYSDWKKGFGIVICISISSGFEIMQKLR